MKNNNGKKILYILVERKVKPSKFIEIYRINHGDINKTLDYFLKCENLKLEYRINGKKDNHTGDGKNYYQRVIDFILKNKVGFIDISEDSYPDILRQIYLPPPLLFFKGNKIKEAKFSVAIVGSRRCTAYGREVTGYISRNLSEIGITVVSGLAVGIDSCAHKAALEGKGGSIGVMGCGIDIVYPPENRFLYEDILSNGSIITEFLPETPPLKSNFPIRNRIISGLCRGVVVIEAGEKSGAAITCEMALKQNREVFAVPGNIFNPMSKGCHKLIKEGAKLVESVDDILEEFSQCYKGILKLCVGSDVNNRKPKERHNTKLCGNELKVYEFIGYKAKSVEEIVRNLRIEVKEVLSILTSLEIKQLIKEDSFNKYSRLF
ncbi:MAG: DNA protecting protein DprA [Actinobacteria bacterium RBG_13_35_12]|nr:MAG: DNA protecting protein DprA [Actinobacteria bacterium RBG_13_35_12]